MNYRLRFFILFSALFLADAHGANVYAPTLPSGPECFGSFSQFSISDPFLSLSKSLKNPSQELINYRWLSQRFSENDPLVSFFRQAMQVAPEHRKELLEIVKNSPIHKDAKDFLSVALYDKDLWKKYYYDIAYNVFDPYMGSHEVWLELLERMPAEIRAQCEKEIATGYAAASKASQTKNHFTMYKTAGKRRGMDAFIRLTETSAENVDTLVKQGMSPKEAYFSEMKRLNAKYFAGTERGNYDFELILEAARRVQKMLVKNKMPDEIGETVLAGSFTNGKAVVGESDIDFFSPNLNNFFREKLAKNEITNEQILAYREANIKYVKSMKDDLEDFAKEKWGKGEIEEPPRDIIGPKESARLNTFQIYVYPDHIDLAVFPRANPEEMVPKPAIYRLE